MNRTSPRRLVSIQLDLEVPLDTYDYRIDDEGRIEYWGDLVLGEQMVGVTAVSTSGPTGSGYVHTLTNEERDLIAEVRRFQAERETRMAELAIDDVSDDVADTERGDLYERAYEDLSRLMPVLYAINEGRTL